MPGYSAANGQGVQQSGVAMADLTLMTVDVLGVWVGLLFSLLILSALLGDHALARLGQHLLVGVGLGYAGVWVWQQVLQPRLFTPIFQASLLPTGPAPLSLWLLLALGLLLWLAGLERIIAPGQAAGDPLPRWRRLLQRLGVIPVALLVGVSVANGFIGLIQGTLMPQFWRAAQMGIDWSAAPGPLLTGLLTLLLTTSTVVHLTMSKQTLGEQPAFVRRLVLLWAGVGKRALWLAGGVIFARLLAARLSLLIALFQFYLESLNVTGLWPWAERIWRSLTH